MRKVVITTLIMMLMTFNIALAEEPTPTTDPGVTPDSTFYVLDKAMEDLRLVFTSNPQNESELLLAISAERIAEAEQLIAEEKEEYVSEVMNDYVTTLEQAQETVGSVITSPDTEDDVKEELVTELEKVANVDEEVTQKLPVDQQTKLEDCVNQSILVANVVKDLDPELVQSLAEQDLGYGQIAKIVALSDASGKSVDEVVTLVKDGMGFGTITKDFGLKTSDLVRNAKNNQKKAQNQVQNQVKEQNQTQQQTQQQTKEQTKIQTQIQTKTQSQINKPENSATNQNAQKGKINAQKGNKGNQIGAKGEQQKQQLHKDSN